MLHAIRRYGLVSEGFVRDAVGETQALGCDTWLLANELEPAAAQAPPGPDRTLFWQRPVSWRMEELAPHRSARARADALAPVLERVAPDVVHAHFGWSAVDLWPACDRTGTPLLATFHGSDATVYPHFRRRERYAPANLRRPNRYAELFEHLPRVIAVSGNVAAELRRHGYAGPIDIVPAGIRLEDFPFRPPRPAPDPVRLIFIGRLVAVKGLDVLLHALGRLPGAPTLDVIGDGPKRADFEALAVRLGLTDRVSFAGALPRAQVAAHLRDADVLAMASRTQPNGQGEGSPVVIKEALATGLPFVATNCGGTREAYPPELVHEIVPEGDVDALSERIGAVIADPGDWPRRAGIGRRFVEERLSWASLARRSAAIYEELAR